MVAVPPAGPVQTLAMALIESSDAPLLLLDGDLKVVGASRSFCESFGIKSASIPGVALADLGAGEWNTPQLASLLRSAAAGIAAVEGYEMDLKRPDNADRRLILTVKRLAYDHGDVRLLLTVTDVTAIRLANRKKDSLLREQTVLLEELQHRVANSLQIIASVLMQSATRVQSEETRFHLRDAHNRVMSIAKLQSYLSPTQVGRVDLCAYFRALCESIAASMISPAQNLVIKVTCDSGSEVQADVSINLGLIVTELVINSLKHGYPSGRGGVITVDYTADGDDWALSVDDDGVGMPKDAALAPPGLGTGIIEALSKRIDAEILVADAKPGVHVAIVHVEHTAGAEAAEPTPTAV